MEFRSLGINSCHVAGFVAEAIVRDIKINNLGFSAFPEITVTWDSDKNFYITLSALGFSIEPFVLSKEVVVSEAKGFKKSKAVSAEVFDVIQKNLAKLEFKVINKT